MSDAEVTLTANGAASKATAKAVLDTTEQQKVIRRKAIREARDAQKTHDRTIMRQLRRKLQKAAARQASQSYSSGQSSGYSSGHSEGTQEGFESGLTEGSDQLSCSDDPDVYWLPACF
jgi:flagellar biosynthesis/type III secretory pathway protein FliH